MKLPMMPTHRTIKLLIFSLALYIVAPLANSQFHDANWYCLENAGNYTTGSTYQNNLLAVLPNVITQASISNFGNYSSIGEGIDKVYTLYNCRGDLNSKQCHDCVKEAAEKILERCPFEKEAILWYEECMIRYANRSIYSLEEEQPYVWNSSPGNDPNLGLAKLVADNIDKLIGQAAYNETIEGYITGKANLAPLDDVYFLVQCTPDILGSRCERCLRAVFRSMAGCCGTTKSSLIMFFPSCHIRYDRASVVLNGIERTTRSPSYLTPPPPTATGGSAHRMIRSYMDSIIISFATLVCMLFMMCTSNYTI